MNTTKVESFITTKKLSETTSRCYNLILEALTASSASRQEIANRTGLRTSSVCARVNELLKLNRIAIAGTKIDDDSGRSVQILRVRG
jgi:hypothetical protein